MKFNIVYLGITLFIVQYTPSLLLSVLNPTSQLHQYLRIKFEAHPFLIMAPGDLNLKKSWNPALMKNQKKLWDEEQKQLEQYKIAKQRQEELNKEKEQLELLKLQYGDDLTNLPRDHKLSLNKMNWMYDDGNVKQQSKINSSGFNEVDEEFLLNKKKVEDMLNNDGISLKRSRNSDESGFNKIISDSSKKASKPLSDDPLLQIKNEQMKRRKIRHRQQDPCKPATAKGDIEKTFAPKPCRPKPDERAPHPRHRHHRKEGEERHGKEGEERRRHRKEGEERRRPIGPRPEFPRDLHKNDHPHPHKHHHKHPHPHRHHHEEDQTGCIEKCPAH